MNDTLTPLLALEKVALAYGSNRVVDDVSLALAPGPSGLALVGESGSGKTSIARALLGLLRPVSGEVLYRGSDLGKLDRKGRRRYRTTIQPVFQDGTEALDPRMKVGSALSEAIGVSPDAALRGEARRARILSLLADVGLDERIADRFPHQISGGQRQRVCIARALAVRPKVLLLDEPTSALDVTVQARVLMLLRQLRDEHDLTYLLITHNLSIVEQLCETTAVMFAGRVVEMGPTRDILRRPAHPYTAALIDALPRMDRPPAADRPRAEAGAAATGCPFRLRCPLAMERCTKETPAFLSHGARSVACHFPDA
ncbi:ABC transporter ATP-binding protein [Microbacterium sp. 13-71-7]|jgi:peptide/nickel transport system ATP-binding protein|uniref:ABC transporter ATP-binding protein n=1 Tax=Microbacterium sp. 13-71-7 TaxID=1970399 RepID=UPI000BDAF65D|nr:ABC transporter ATP-binding protein [Microbacterium sp. 13-71-7]OZB85009.1 MAG: dipeptide/oligopeptide/nickel ABC transporter ATP-binding protein [Microbacterium sp. 13-71-7]